MRWHQLLHFDGTESRADDELFFVHPEGKYNPQLELERFIAIYEGRVDQQKKFGRFNLDLSCAFPARTEFLIKQKIIRPKSVKCSEWDKWKQEVSPSALMVVFSTAYPNNPGSMFGHTFLRFKKASSDKPLLDYSANYSALTASDDSGFMYAMKGIFGGYRGYFDLHPHYMLVNDYNHSENRDLIEYHLNLNQSQLDFLFAHLWELYQTSSFDYYFTWENCSFHLAELLNIVLDRPLDLPHRWFYLPVDLIHALMKREGLVSTISQRASQKRVLRKVDPQSLDGKIHYLNYLKFQKKGKLSEEENKEFIETLRERAKRGESSKPLEFKPFENQPHLAHEAARLALGYSQRREGALRLKYRSGYHEFLSPDQGLESFSQFLFLSPTLSLGKVEGRTKVILDEFSLIEIASLHPVEYFDRQLSWKVGARYERFLDESRCLDCGRFQGEGKMGFSFGDRGIIMSFLLGGVAEISGRFQNSYRLNVAYELLFGASFKALKLFSSFEGRANIEHFKDDFDHRMNLGLSGFISKNNTVRLEFKKLWSGRNWRASGDELALEWGVAF